MVTRLLFQPGWVHVGLRAAGVDPLTGNPKGKRREETVGTGLVQERLLTAQKEVSQTGTIDERLVLFHPVVDVLSTDEFIGPDGKRWLAIQDGYPRGIPGKPAEYVAVRVRRAKEKE